MKALITEQKRVIISNPNSLHNYFAWPSIELLNDGRIVVGCSGFRRGHICPFGKGVLSFSSDEGETWTLPMVAIDTVLDDRDVGLCRFGKSGLIVTTFNNSVEFQRRKTNDTYYHSYLDNVTPQHEEDMLGSLFAVSNDNGRTFGKLHKSPVTSPHGPIELKDGSILWVGRTFSDDDSFKVGKNNIHSYRVFPNGNMEYLGEINAITDEYGSLLSCEPYAIELPGGEILCIIRVQRYGDNKAFTMYKSVSGDGGRTWSVPEQICDKLEGAPPHIIIHSSGTLVCTYGHREVPYGIRAAFSSDNGKIWDFGHELCSGFPDEDLGYPATVELSDGSLLTIFYARETAEKPAEIMQVKWQLEK